MVKNPPANAGDIRDVGWIPGLVRSPGGRHGNPLQCSCLENPMDRGSWWATVHGVAKSRIGLSMHMILQSNQLRAHMLCTRPRAAAAKHQRLGAENTKLTLSQSGGQKSEVKVWAGLTPSEASRKTVPTLPQPLGSADDFSDPHPHSL